jgi:hypothetical protein
MCATQRDQSLRTSFQKKGCHVSGAIDSKEKKRKQQQIIETIYKNSIRWQK